MNVCEAVTQTLIEGGIDTVFGVPGELSIQLEKEIWTNDRVRYVMARKESAVPHQAWGYADSGSGLAATLVIRGPGDMNAVNGLFNALDDSVPLVHMSVDVAPSERGTGAIHEAPQNAYDEVLKENISVTSPAAIVPELARGIALAREHPRGPVRISIPDSFLDETDTPPADVAYPLYSNATVDDDPVRSGGGNQDLVAAIEAADRPLLLAGGGVKAANAGPQLREFVDRTDTPVVSTRRAKGVFPEDHDLFLDTIIGFPPPELRRVLEMSDLLVALGTDLDAVTTGGGTLELPDELIHVTLGTERIGKLYEPSLTVVEDVRDVLAGLLDSVDPNRMANPDYAADIQAVRAENRTILDDVLVDSDPPMYAANVAAELERRAPADLVVTTGISQSSVWVDKMFPVPADGEYVAQGSWISMGAALPAAIGAKVAHPDRPVIAIAGDGDYLMTIYELHTLVEQDIPVVSLVLNSQGYGAIADHAKRHANFNEFEWGDESPISFSTLADSMGLTATTVDSQAALGEALDEAFRSSEPSLIEVPIESKDPRIEFDRNGD